jgi:hypothetical protein
MTRLDHPSAGWRKSSHSGPEGGDCIEVAALYEATVGLRDSKNPGGGHLHLSVPAWQALLSSIKSG